MAITPNINFILNFSKHEKRNHNQVLFKKYFLVLFLLMGFAGYIKAQNIDFTAGEGLPK
jgi:hypothetical protein